MKTHGSWIGALVTAATLAGGCAGDDGVGDDDVGDDAGDDGGGTATQFLLRIENVGPTYPFVKSAAFDTAVGETVPGPIGPGQLYDVKFLGGRGAKLSFVTMFAESNDFFFAPGGDGIELYEPNGKPFVGDVTSQLALWDAGTELNEEPGRGPSQAPRQPSPNFGSPDPDAAVRRAPDTFGNLPRVEEVIQATLIYQDGGRFILRIRNVSTATTLRLSTGATKPVPLSPGMYVVHAMPNPLFTPGAPYPRNGLEQIAEDGNPMPLAEDAARQTGVTVPLSPVAWVVHASPAPIFTPGETDRGEGLEPLAEDGDPAVLGASLVAQAGAGRAGTFGTAPIAPGEVFAAPFAAMPGERLSFATMFAESNDLFFAPGPEGIALFDADRPLTGDVTATLGLWDAGTEWNQEPGIGSDQAPRQPAPGFGPETVDPIDIVDDGYAYPAPGDLIRVTVSAIEQ